LQFTVTKSESQEIVDLEAITLIYHGWDDCVVKTNTKSTLPTNLRLFDWISERDDDGW